MFFSKLLFDLIFKAPDVLRGAADEDGHGMPWDGRCRRWVWGIFEPWQVFIDFHRFALSFPSNSCKHQVLAAIKTEGVLDSERKKDFKGSHCGRDTMRLCRWILWVASHLSFQCSCWGRGRGSWIHLGWILRRALQVQTEMWHSSRKVCLPRHSNDLSVAWSLAFRLCATGFGHSTTNTQQRVFTGQTGEANHRFWCRCWRWRAGQMFCC